MEVSESKNAVYQNLWDAAKAVLKGQCILLNAHVKKEKRSQINSIKFHLIKTKREKQNQPKLSRSQEIIKKRVEIHETKNRKY